MKSWAVIVVAGLLLGCETGPRERHSHSSQVAGSGAASKPVHVMAPDEGDVVWFFNESPDELGSGGELQIYIDPVKHPEAGASFAKFTLGVGGALPIHRHAKTEEIAYILEGHGVAIALDGQGLEREIPIVSGTVWYNPHGAWHAVRNLGETPLIMVFAVIPNEKQGLLSFFRKIGVAPGNEAVTIPPEEFERLAHAHDMILYSPEVAEVVGHHEDDEHDTKEGSFDHEHR